MRRNAAQYLRLRNERHAATKFGFNFVLLHGHADQVLEIVELIAEVNREAGRRHRRQVDFLTLREDYSVPPDRGLSNAERRGWSRCSPSLEERCRREDLLDLHIDFGYALYPESQGVVGQPLEMVDYADMRPVAIPRSPSWSICSATSTSIARPASSIVPARGATSSAGSLPTQSLEDVVAGVPRVRPDD